MSRAIDVSATEGTVKIPEFFVSASTDKDGAAIAINEQCFAAACAIPYDAQFEHDLIFK